MNFVGTNATFICVSPIKTCVHTIWYQEFVILFYAQWLRIDYVEHPSPGDKFIAENSPSGCKLTVTNVQLADSGAFMCKFLNAFERIAELRVFGKLFLISVCYTAWNNYL